MPLELVARLTRSSTRVVAGSEGWLLAVITNFVERRVRAGEEPHVGDFDVIDGSNAETVSAVIAELEGVLPQSTVRAFHEWRRRRSEVESFGTIGRI